MNFDEIAARTLRNGGILEARMQELRDALRSDKLGSNVRREISDRLRRAELGSLPIELPNDQRHVVILYALGSDAGRALADALRLAELDRLTWPEAS